MKFQITRENYPRNNLVSLEAHQVTFPKFHIYTTAAIKKDLLSALRDSTLIAPRFFLITASEDKKERFPEHSTASLNNARLPPALTSSTDLPTPPREICDRE